MDGIFVCYHNTAEIFGFQYLSREEMDECIYGNSVTGDAVFKIILQLYNNVGLYSQRQMRFDKGSSDNFIEIQAS